MDSRTPLPEDDDGDGERRHHEPGGAADGRGGRDALFHVGTNRFIRETDFTRDHVRTLMTDRDPADLLPGERMETQALEGEVTQIHRGHQYAEEGDTFTIDGTTFEVTDVTERTLGDLTDADARAEGMDDLEAYRGLLERAHEDFEWDDDSEVVRHRFERT